MHPLARRRIDTAREIWFKKSNAYTHPQSTYGTCRKMG